MALYGYNLELRFDIKDATTKGETLATYDWIYAYRNLGIDLERNYLKARNGRLNTTTRNTN